MHAHLGLVIVLIHSCFVVGIEIRFVYSGGGRYLSTDSNKIDEPFNVEEAETVHVPPPPTEKVT